MIHHSRFVVFLACSFLGFTPPASARTCKTLSAAADYKCTTTISGKEIDLKYRYRKSDIRSVSINYLKEVKGPYARESFIVKKDPNKPKKNRWKNCRFFGLIGKCVRKKLKICDSILTASSSETYGLFNKYKYKRSLSFDLGQKTGSYSYFRRTPKASPDHQLDVFEIEFDKCKLIKEY